MTLAEIIAADPDGRGYASMSDAAIHADLTDPRHTQRKATSFALFNELLFDEGVTLAVVQAQQAPANPAHAVANLVAEMIDRAMKSGLSGINLDKAGNTALFDAMEGAGLMNSTQRIAVMALGDAPASLFDLHNLGSFTHLDVAKITGGAN